MDVKSFSNKRSPRPDSRSSMSSRDHPHSNQKFSGEGLTKANLKSDNESDISDASDDEESPQVNPFQNYWNNFGDSLKRIHDDSESFLIRPKPTFQSSDHFKDVMTNLYGNTEYGVPKAYTKLKNKINRLANATSIASRLLQQAARSREEESANAEEDNNTDDQDHKELVSELKGAKRGWKLLKRHVHEQAMEKNTEKTKLNWDMIAHHVKGMTDLEKARMDLYERYGVVPSMQNDGKYECKNVMWSERAIALNQIHPVQYNVIPKTKSEKRRTQSARARAVSVGTVLRPGSETLSNRTRAVSMGHILRPTSERRCKTAQISGRTFQKRESLSTTSVNPKNIKK